MMSLQREILNRLRSRSARFISRTSCWSQVKRKYNRKAANGR